MLARRLPSSGAWTIVWGSSTRGLRPWLRAVAPAGASYWNPRTWIATTAVGRFGPAWYAAGHARLARTSFVLSPWNCRGDAVGWLRTESSDAELVRSGQRRLTAVRCDLPRSVPCDRYGPGDRWWPAAGLPGAGPAGRSTTVAATATNRRRASIANDSCDPVFDRIDRIHGIEGQRVSPTVVRSCLTSFLVRGGSRTQRCPEGPRRTMKLRRLEAYTTPKPALRSTAFACSRSAFLTSK